MKVHKFNIVNPKKYTTKQGEEKTYYAPVGSMTVFIKDDGSQSRVMNLHANDKEYLLFPQKPKEQKPNATVQGQPAVQATAPAQPEPTVEYPSDDINPEDIPF